MTVYHLAVDIGASSGRHMIGWLKNGRIQLKEIYRFENRLIEKNGHLCWDIDGLAEHVIQGIAACAKAGFAPATMGIDTWAVDFVLLDQN
jgi:rhamnulokinase